MAADQLWQLPVSVHRLIPLMPVTHYDCYHSGMSDASKDRRRHGRLASRDVAKGHPVPGSARLCPAAEVPGRAGTPDGAERPSPAAPERPASPRERLIGGMGVGVCLAAAAFVLAITFGAMVRAQGWGIAAPLVCSAIVFSGSAQFALASALSGGGVVPAVTAAGLINARFLPMGVAIAASLRGGRLRRAVEGQAVVDASWAAAHLGGGRFDRERLIGATLPQWPAWVGGTAIGALIAPPPGVVSSLGLDVVFPAFFVVLLVDELRSSPRARLAAAASTGLAVLSSFVLPAGLVVLVSGMAAILGIPAKRRRRAR